MKADLTPAILRSSMFPRFAKRSKLDEININNLNIESWFNLKGFYKDKFLSSLAANYLFNCFDNDSRDIDLIVAKEESLKMCENFKKIFNLAKKEVSYLIINIDIDKELNDKKLIEKISGRKICFVDSFIKSEEKLKSIEDTIEKKYGGDLKSCVTLFSSYKSKKPNNPVPLYTIFRKEDIERYQIFNLVLSDNF